MFKAGTRGFTLIELLIVVALFAAGTVTLLQVFSTSLYGGAENENTLVATALAQETMERIRNDTYGSVVDATRTPVPNYTFFESEVAVDDNTPVTNMKQVTVNVYWNERPHDATPGAGDVKISLVTYVSDI